MQFAFALDTEVRFGIGSYETTAAVVRLFGTRVALVAGKHIRADDDDPLGLRSILQNGGASIVDIVTTHGEPDDTLVAETATRFRAKSAEAVVAVGGGSVLDLAKAAAVIAAGTNLHDALEGAVVTSPGIPVIAVPTTAGSGAEVSRGAIVLDRTARRKRGIRGRPVAPRHAIVDPGLSRSAGSRVTAEAGFDAMAHAIETGVSRAASRLNILLAGDAIRSLLLAIPTAMENPDDIDARQASAFAALLMGINLATASTCLPHRMQYPLASRAGCGHARGVAALYPAWLAHLAAYAPKRLAALASQAGIVERGGAGDAQQLIDRITAWMTDLGMITSLSSLGVVAADLPELVAMVEGSLENDPGPSDPGHLLELYRSSL